MQTKILNSGEMVVIFAKEEVDLQIAHLESLIPADDEQYEEITILLNIVKKKPNLKLVN